MINIVSFFTSLYAGFAVFSIIGYMANESGVPVDKVIDSGALVMTETPTWFHKLSLYEYKGIISLLSNLTSGEFLITLITSPKIIPLIMSYFVPQYQKFLKSVFNKMKYCFL